ncbi:MAG: phytanoyl-CoA dioxygenase family protein [Candidatus Latescibacterota bacterium]|nr:phytanoyl-CoA dioxygenase family protein [Candidatus Latescibacterota bacterium]
MKQDTHGDHGPFLPSSDCRTPVFKIVIKIPLCDYTAENGATEFWPGTHKETPILCNTGRYGDKSLYEPMLAEWREKTEPEQAVAPRGSALL